MRQHTPSAKRKSKRTRALKAVTSQNQNCEKRLLRQHLHASATRVRPQRESAGRYGLLTSKRRQWGARATGTLPETTRPAKFIGDDSKQKCNKGEHADQSGSRNAAMRSGCAAHSS